VAAKNEPEAPRTGCKETASGSKEQNVDKERGGGEAGEADGGSEQRAAAGGEAPI